MSEISEHDVIVVGGGPAGAAAAWELTRRGREVLVLDLASFPREKLCAGWITPEVVEDLEMDPQTYPHRFLTFDALSVSLKGMHFSMRSRQHSIRRYEFDAWLLERSGAEVQTHAVHEVQRDGDAFLLDGRFRCRHLIGAGGTRCPVYRDLFRSLRPRAKPLQVVTQELEFAHNWHNGDCRLWFFDEHLPGYAWYVPKANGYVNVGVGAVAATLKRRGDDIKRHWRLLVARLAEEHLVDGPIGAPGGYSYYLRGRAQSAEREGNAYLVGDAAGLATRDMCEGIGPAVRSGLAAARSILGEREFDLDGIAAHTLGSRLAGYGLDLALTRRRV